MPRHAAMVAAVAAVGGRIFGDRRRDRRCARRGVLHGRDNWVFDPAAGQWSRIRDLPTSSGNFPTGAITFGDRYIVLVGGFQYAKVQIRTATLREPYGKAGKFNGVGDYHNDVFVYDTRTNLFGTADSLPLNNNMPNAVIRRDEIFLIGGETGGAVVEG